MQLTAVFISCTEVQQGVSQNGKPWSKIIAMFETIERFPKQVAVNFNGDHIGEVQQLRKGELIEVNLDAQSREFEGKFYTDLWGWGVKKKYDTPAPAL